jgi:hypothetical protein
MKSKGHTGAVGELAVSNYFLSAGFEVFRNVAQSGPADLTVWNTDTDNIIKVDVKSFNSPYTKKDGTYTTGAQPRLRSDDNVWVVTFVHEDSSVRLPEGLWEALGIIQPE